MTDFYVEANRLPEERVVHTSPSGRYILTIDIYTTKAGCWSYSRGRISNADGVELGDVKRNYARFPFLWVEGKEVKGPSDKELHDFLICGAHYQGQTVIDLCTKGRRDANGQFCWAKYKLYESTLVVNGCFRRGPYEYKFFDFSDPIRNGWPELGPEDGLEQCFYDYDSKLEAKGAEITWMQGHYVFRQTGETKADVKRKIYAAYCKVAKAREEGATELTTLQQEEAELDAFYYPEDEEAEDSKLWDFVPDHRIVLRREGMTLKRVSEWKSELTDDKE